MPGYRQRLEDSTVEKYFRTEDDRLSWSTSWARRHGLATEKSLGPALDLRLLSVARTKEMGTAFAAYFCGQGRTVTESFTCSKGPPECMKVMSRGVAWGLTLILLT